MKVKELESFPPNSNPFHHDLYHMGQALGDNIMIMFSQHKDNDYVIIINLKTGKRIRVEL